MKIIMATHFFPSHHGGIENVADQLYRGLTTNGHDVVWIAADSTPPPNPVGRSHAVAFRISNFVENKTGLPLPFPTIAGLKQIRNAIAGADVVVLHDCLYLSNVVAFLLARKRKLPIVIIQHIGSIEYENPIPRLVMKVGNSIFTRPMLSRAEQVVFISEKTRDYFTDLRFKSPPELVFNGVDTDLYRTVEVGEKRLALRKKYGLPIETPVILFVGRFVESKGLSILKQMVAARPQWTWAFAGRRGTHDPDSWGAGNVRVFAELPDDNLAELHRACDLFVLPSRTEAFPLVVQQALACGLPVVCMSDVLRSDSAIVPYIRGVPIYAGDDSRTAREFVLAMDDLIVSGAHPSAEQLRAFAASRYSWRCAVHRYSQIVSRVAGSGSA